jgi:hypothetical protein
MSRPPSGPVRVPAGPVLRVLAAALLAAFTGAHAAKNEAKMEKRDLRREMAGGEDAGRKPGRGDKDSAAATQKSRAEEASARGLERLRDQLAVEDDAEWAVILERINRVTEARGTLWKGSSSGKPGSVIAEKGKKSSRSANPEQDSLRYAIRDNLPDAEVKARLARARHVHEQAETRLAQAQSDLRAVLSLRQEAIAVLAGLLPP